MTTTFPDIASSAWEHPADRAALQTLRAVPGFQAVTRATIGRLQDSFALRRLVGQATPAQDRQPRVAGLWRDVQASLDAPEVIPLLIKEGAEINGFTMGLRHPHVVLTQGAVDQLPLSQVRAILAHELGHVMSGHVLYKTLVRLLDAGRWWLGAGGLNVAVTVPILLALYEWDRKSELSADRAELLVVGDPAVSIAVLRASQQGVQAKTDARYARLADVWKPGADALAAMERAFSRHPPLDERIAELEGWGKSPELAAIRRGDYPRRPTDRADVDALEARVSELSAGLRAGLRAGADEVAERASEQAVAVGVQASALGALLTEQGETASAWLRKLVEQTGGDEDLPD